MPQILVETWPLLAVLAVLAVVALLLNSRPRSAPPGFRRRPDLVDQHGQDLFRALRLAVGASHHVLAKVRLGELVSPQDPDRHDDADRHRIDCGHVDFVLCHPRSLQPQLVVQCDLPPPTPAAEDTEEGESEPADANEPPDTFIRHVLTAAGVPWLSLCPDDRTDVRQLRRLIRQRLK